MAGIVEVGATGMAGSTTLHTIPIADVTNGSITLVTSPGATAVIYVTGYALSFSGTVNATFQSSTGPASIGGLMRGVVNSYFTQAVMPPSFMFSTAKGDDLNLNLSAGTQVDGWVTFFFGPV